ALLIAEPLVVEHEFSDLAEKLCTLPLALQATSLLTLIFRSRRAYRPDCVGRCTQLMSCYMSHRHGLSGGVSRFLRGAEHRSGRGIGRKSGRAGLRHRDLTPRPSTRLFDRSARTVVTGLRLLEEVQYVLRAISRPHCKKAMISVLEGAAATHGNKPRVSVLGEDDLSVHSFSFYPTGRCRCSRRAAGRVTCTRVFSGMGGSREAPPYPADPRAAADPGRHERFLVS